jgi:hypothetical protein
MYGQLKSTVKCLECGNISITFDPFLTLSLPITRPNFFKVPFVPYEFFRQRTEGNGDSSEEDPDFKDANNMVRMEQFEFCFPSTPQTTVMDIKKEVAQRVSKVGEQKILPENLELCICKYGEVYEAFEDNACVDTIDGEDRLFLIETHKGQIQSDMKLLELNFSRFSLNRKGDPCNQLISNAIPRYEVFKLTDTVLDMKRKVFNRCASMFADKDVDEEWLAANIILWIKDNTPRSKSGGKVECEFCAKYHSNRDDICKIRS